jgi:hypothetical protein
LGVALEVFLLEDIFEAPFEEDIAHIEVDYIEFLFVVVELLALLVAVVDMEVDMLEFVEAFLVGASYYY